MFLSSRVGFVVEKAARFNLFEYLEQIILWHLIFVYQGLVDSSRGRLGSLGSFLYEELRERGA